MWLDSPAAPMASHFLHGEDEEDIDEPLRRLRQFRESFDVLSHPVV